MKMYISGFHPLPDEELAKQQVRHPLAKLETHYVVYDATPEWTFSHREVADAELRILHGMRVHLKEHYCQLELEELVDGQYAIVCNDHPSPALT